MRPRRAIMVGTTPRRATRPRRGLRSCSGGSRAQIRRRSAGLRLVVVVGGAAGHGRMRRGGGRRGVGRGGRMDERPVPRGVERVIPSPVLARRALVISASLGFCCCVVVGGGDEKVGRWTLRARNIATAAQRRHWLACRPRAFGSEAWHHGTRGEGGITASSSCH